MSEVEALKTRIDNSRTEGVKTAHIREDYDPVGESMIQQLLNTGEYVSRKVPPHSFDSEWRVFNEKWKPY